MTLRSCSTRTKVCISGINFIVVDGVGAMRMVDLTARVVEGTLRMVGLTAHVGGTGARGQKPRLWRSTVCGLSGSLVWVS